MLGNNHNFNLLYDKMKINPDAPINVVDGIYAAEAIGNDRYKGLTKREHMAIEFTKALVIAGVSDEQGNAIMALRQADELIKQLNNEK